jgi:hypothetical protein
MGQPTNECLLWPVWLIKCLKDCVLCPPFAHFRQTASAFQQIGRKIIEGKANKQSNAYFPPHCSTTSPVPANHLVHHSFD